MHHRRLVTLLHTSHHPPANRWTLGSRWIVFGCTRCSSEQKRNAGELERRSRGGWKRGNLFFLGLSLSLQLLSQGRRRRRRRKRDFYILVNLNSSARKRDINVEENVEKRRRPLFFRLASERFLSRRKKNWKKCLVSSTFRVLSERYCVQYSATSSWMTFRMAEVISVTRETRRRIQFTRCGIVAFGHARRRNRATQLGLTAGSNWRPHSLFYLKKRKKRKTENAKQSQTNWTGQRDEDE